MVHGLECIEAQFSWHEVSDMWERFLPPIRPSPMEQQVYEECIKEIADGQGSSILILGVTPELRKLAVKYRCSVVAVDLHTVMIRAMNHLMDDLELVKRDEDIVKGYWLLMPFKRGQYDLILSDCSLNSLTKGEARSLLMELKQLLKEDGYLCMRVMICPEGCTERNILDIFMEHRKGHEEGREIFKDLYVRILCSVEAYEPISRKSSVTKARKKWRRLYRDGEISSREFEAFEKVLPKGEYSPTILKKSELEDLLMRHFELIHRRNAESELTRYSPIYFLKRR